MADLMCALCSITQWRGAVGDPCPDRETCTEDGPCDHAILVADMHTADAWVIEHDKCYPNCWKETNERLRKRSI